MNEQQPYEKHLVDKLDQLTQPGDANRHWPKMKSLLDRDLPEGNDSNKRTGRWWMYGIIAGILVTGALLGTSFFSKNNKDQSSVTVSATAIPGNSKETTPSSAVSLQTSSEKEPAVNESANNKTKNEPAVHNTDNTKIAATDILPRNDNTDNTITETEKDGSFKNTSSNTTRTASNKKDKQSEQTGVITGNKRKEWKDAAVVTPDAAGTENNDRTNNNTKKIVKDIFIDDTKGKAFSAGKEPGRTQRKQVVDKPSLSVNRIVYKGTNTAATDDNSADMISAAAVSQTIDNSGSALVGPAYIFPDSLQKDYTASFRTIPYVALAKSRFKTNSALVKGLKNRIVGTGDNKNFVVGLSLPLSLPLSDQRVIGYNFAGGPNTSLDYLPAPHVQYHISQKSYVQAELQFVSPQYIQPALLFQNKYELSGSGSNYRFITNSVFARKLYYFNLPIGIHYSPFKNFYLGSGVQFSSLVSGIAMYEQRGYNSLSPSSGDSLFSQRFSKFKNDSLSAALNGNEVRVLLDANYYWHRFTVGLRYNQAVSNYVSIRVSNTSPLFTDKNKSMQFYLRYNLWEDKKRKKNGLMAGR